MPPQYESTWGSPQLPLPGTEDFDSLDVFNTFEDLNLNLNFDDNHPLFDALLPECDLPDMMEDLLGPFQQVRHDCMWAGTCVDDKDRERPNPQDRLQQEAVSKVPSERLVDSHHEVLSVQSSKTTSVKCNQRSILRTNLNLSTSVSDQVRTAPPEDSDDSGRPETPQSMASETEFKHEDVDLTSSLLDDDETDEDEEVDDEDEEVDDDDEESHSPAFNVADVTGQTVRTSYHKQGYESSEGLHRGRASRLDSRPQQMSNHFFNDHSYHLSKSDVSASIPGNLTPSDSEDEIDVVSVCGEKGTSSSRSSSQGALPSNPSARDRHALQQTMATAMKKTGYSSYPSYLSGRQPSGKLARMQAERQAERARQRERKRRAQERDDSSEEDTVRPSKKRAKHHAYKHAAPKRGHSFKMSSSDSEPDSCEKRSLHNNMERQRRVDLRNAFEDLRVVVPALSPNPRAAKVVILKEASHFCHQLTADSKSLQQESSCLERERDRLLARVSFLRKQVASMRRGM